MSLVAWFRPEAERDLEAIAAWYEEQVDHPRSTATLRAPSLG